MAFFQIRAYNGNLNTELRTNISLIEKLKKKTRYFQLVSRSFRDVFHFALQKRTIIVKHELSKNK